MPRVKRFHRAKLGAAAIAVAAAAILSIPAGAAAIGCPASYDPPTAAFTSTAQPAQAIAFNASGSAPGTKYLASDPPDCLTVTQSPMPITGYSWDFGDGGLAGSGVSPTHTYATGGTYVVRLTVSNAAPAPNNHAQIQHTVAVATTPAAPTTQPGPASAAPRKCKKGRKLKHGRCVKKRH